MPKVFIHIKCGGAIDTEKRICTRCGRRWNPISFWLTPSGIRMIPVRKERVLKYSKEALKKKNLSGVARIPGVAGIAGLLPKWPRWARILATAVFVVIVILVILLVRGVL